MRGFRTFAFYYLLPSIIKNMIFPNFTNRFNLFSSSLVCLTVVFHAKSVNFCSSKQVKWMLMYIQLVWLCLIPTCALRFHNFALQHFERNCSPENFHSLYFSFHFLHKKIYFCFGEEKTIYSKFGLIAMKFGVFINADCFFVFSFFDE